MRTSRFPITYEEAEEFRFFVLEIIDIREVQSLRKVIPRPECLRQILDEKWLLKKVTSNGPEARAVIPVVYESSDNRFLQIVAAYTSFDAAYRGFANDLKPGRMIVDSRNGDNDSIVIAELNEKNQIVIDDIVVKSYVDVRQPLII